jgi:putative addiction module component (TIGR02574 family)
MDIGSVDFSNLSSVERLQLAQTLIDGVLLESKTEMFTDEQLAELDRRSAEIDSGTATFEPWETVRDRLLSRR